MRGRLLLLFTVYQHGGFEQTLHAGARVTTLRCSCPFCNRWWRRWLLLLVVCRVADLQPARSCCIRLAYYNDWLLLMLLSAVHTSGNRRVRAHTGTHTRLQASLACLTSTFFIMYGCTQCSFSICSRLFVFASLFWCIMCVEKDVLYASSFCIVRQRSPVALARFGFFELSPSYSYTCVVAR